MVHKVLIGLVAAVLLWPDQTMPAGLGSPEPVSPGDRSVVEAVSEACPTFSWSSVRRSSGYRLAVYAVENEGRLGEAVIRQRLGAGVFSWTPPLRLGLQPGASYAWVVGAETPKGEVRWSEPALFRVQSGPSRTDFEEALSLVRSYLAVQADETAVVSEPDANSVAPVESPTPLAPPPGTQLSVDGNVDATSFSGDGSSLTALDPQSLSAGTAAIDISGTASNVTGTVAITQGGTGATSAAGARTNLGVAAGPHTSDTDTTCDGVPCDGTHFSNLDWHSLLNRPPGLVLPRGTIVAYVGTVVPAGWALCDGGTYTAPDGDAVTTPDLRNRFLYGHSSFPVPQYSYGGTSSHSHAYTDYILATHPNPGPDLVSTIFYGVKGDTWAGDGVRITVEGSLDDGSGCPTTGCVPPPGTDPASVYTFNKGTDVQAHEPPHALVTFIMKL